MTYNHLWELLLAAVYRETQGAEHAKYYSLMELAASQFGETDAGKVFTLAQDMRSRGLVKAVLSSGPNASALLTGLGTQYVEEGGQTGVIPLYLEAASKGELDRFREELLNGTVEARIKAAQEEAMPEEDAVAAEGPLKIFLSHKGVNKAMVRQFHSVLKLLSLDPWLDEDAMPAGTELERGILKGFEESCAAVFFITPDFKDENFLATEINYALAEKRKKRANFAIIPIVFEVGGAKGVVPALLRQYVWKDAAGDMDALQQIIKALPVRLGVAAVAVRTGGGVIIDGTKRTAGLIGRTRGSQTRPGRVVVRHRRPLSAPGPHTGRTTRR